MSTSNTTFLKEKSKKGIVIILTALMIVPTAYFGFQPQKAEAFTTSLTCLNPGGVAVQAAGNGQAAAATVTDVPTVDKTLFTQLQATAKAVSDVASKECVQNQIFKQISKAFIDKLTQDIVNWINNGFKGGPTFVTNPEQFFTNFADQQIGEYINSTALGWVCDPFRPQIQLALRKRYTNYNYYGCTITQIVNNVDSFVQGDFTQGGWTGWLSLGQNNSYNSLVQAQESLNFQINARQNIELSKLNWGNGFLSIKNPSTGEIQTPGTVIGNYMNKVTGSNLDTAQLANSFDDIIFALLNQLTQQLLTKGLRG